MEIDMKTPSGQLVPECIESGAYSFAPCVPSDATILANVRRVYVGGAGIVQAQNDQGATVPFTCVAGTTLNISPTKIMAATTATLIVLIF